MVYFLHELSLCVTSNYVLFCKSSGTNDDINGFFLSWIETWCFVNNSNMVTWQISHLYVFFPLNEPWLDFRASNYKMKWFLSFMNWGRMSNRVSPTGTANFFLAHPSVVAIFVADCGLFLILKPINKNFMTPYWYPLGIFLISPRKKTQGS